LVSITKSWLFFSFKDLVLTSLSSFWLSKVILISGCKSSETLIELSLLLILLLRITSLFELFSISEDDFLSSLMISSLIFSISVKDVISFLILLSLVFSSFSSSKKVSLSDKSFKSKLLSIISPFSLTISALSLINSNSLGMTKFEVLSLVIEFFVLLLLLS